MNIVKPDEPKYDVGVIVGRFQVPELHDAHLLLLRGVTQRHTKVIVFLGVAPTGLTRNNPLDFESRKQMIQEAFPKVNIVYQNDNVSDEAWSKILDGQISALTTFHQKVVLYGGRDSFKKHYSGRYPVLEIEAEGAFSGTEIRQNASVEAVDSADFRKGVVWAVYNKFPVSYTTVDIAVFDEKQEKILLARKPHEKEWRFIGGFAEPSSTSFEQDARREVEEEASIEVTDPKYVGSFKVSDWRYAKEVDKIKTILFECTYFSGKADARDDIEDLKWFDFASINLDNIVPAHRPLMEKLIQHKKGN